jgi:hypothetical protein
VIAKVDSTAEPTDVERTYEYARNPDGSRSKNSTELIAYYQALITAAKEDGLKDELRDPFPYFCVKPVIATDIALADFSWYNTVAEATTVLWAIAGFGRDNPEPQELLDDLDQGWRVRIAAWRGRIGLVEWNWEQTEAPPQRAFHSTPRSL